MRPPHINYPVLLAHWSQRFIAVLAVLFATVLMASCSDQNQVVLVTESGRHTFSVELAQTADERAQGLMFRQELADDAGMLFDFQEERQVAFWMRNTFVPLDMIFVAANGEIKHIHPNARPHDETSIPSQEPVRFVFEIPAGRSAEIGLIVGDHLEHALVSN